MTTNLLLEAREIVRTQPPSLQREHLRVVADALDTAYKAVQKEITRSTVKNFVAQVTRTLLAIENIHASSPPSPPAGAAREPPKQASVVAAGAALGGS